MKNNYKFLNTLKSKLFSILSIMGIISLMFGLIGTAFSHSGRTNSSGCHNNHKTGGYHCHNSVDKVYSGTREVSSSSSTRVKSAEVSTDVGSLAGSPDVKKTGQVKKAKPKKGPTNKKTKTVQARRNKPKAGSKSSRSQSKKASAVKGSTSGHVDTYKSANFKGSMNSLSGAAEVSNKESNQRKQKQGEEKKQGKKESHTSMSPDFTRRILIEHVPQFRYCYQTLSSKTKASIQLSFTIGTHGHVKKATIKDISNNSSAKVESCMLDVLRAIRFPPPNGGKPKKVTRTLRNL